MTSSLIDHLSPFSEGTIHSMIRPGDVVSHSTWPRGGVSKVHVVRIGGAGMSAVARLALESGIEVTGSESQDGQFLAPLRSKGARITVGFGASNIEAGTDIVVVSTAVRADNPEVQYARSQGIPVMHRATALAGLLGKRELIAVAGTHGKTTTTSMAVMALRGAGADPAWAVGAAVDQLGANAGFGGGTYAVVEADESDGSFVAFAPEVLVLTNFEADHLDFHESYADLRAVTSAFISRVTEADGGVLVACADDEGSLGLARDARAAGIPVVLYGFSDEADWQVTDDRSTALGAAASVRGPGGEPADLELKVPGRHNLLNAVAAVVAGAQLGFAPTDLAAGVGSFTGAQRRFQSAGEVEGTEVIDDYAHHPREVAATVSAGRERSNGEPVVAVFQPHLYSRTKAFAGEFASALSNADTVVVLPIYAAREDDDPSVTNRDIASLILKDDDHLHIVDDIADAPRVIASAASGAGVVLMMGAGDVVELTPRVLDELRGLFS